MLFNKLIEVLASNFLFSLNQHLDVHRERPMLFHVGFDRFEMDQHLTLIVRRTAGIEIFTADRSFKRRRCP